VTAVIQGDLFGAAHVVRDAPAAESPCPKAAPAVLPHNGATAPGAIEGGDVASFRELRGEVLLHLPTVGEVWLVPKRTAQNRNELVAEELARIVNTVAAFPGAGVIALRKRAPDSVVTAPVM
jgi:hypothetical protein